MPITTFDWEVVIEYFREAGVDEQKIQDDIRAVRTRIEHVTDTGRRWCPTNPAQYDPQTRNDCFRCYIWTLLNTFQGGQDLDGHSRKVYGGYVRDWIMRGAIPNDADFQMSTREYMIAASAQIGARAEADAWIHRLQTQLRTDWPYCAGHPKTYFVRQLYINKDVINPATAAVTRWHFGWNTLGDAKKVLAPYTHDQLDITDVGFGGLRSDPMILFIVTANSDIAAANDNVGSKNDNYAYPGIQNDGQKKNFLKPKDPGATSDVDNLLITKEGLSIKKELLSDPTSPFSNLPLAVFHAMRSEFEFYKDATDAGASERIERLLSRGYTCTNYREIGRQPVLDDAGQQKVDYAGTPVTRGVYQVLDRPSPDFIGCSMLQNRTEQPASPLLKFNEYEDVFVMPQYVDLILKANGDIRKSAQELADISGIDVEDVEILQQQLLTITIPFTENFIGYAKRVTDMNLMIMKTCHRLIRLMRPNTPELLAKFDESLAIYTTFGNACNNLKVVRQQMVGGDLSLLIGEGITIDLDLAVLTRPVPPPPRPSHRPASLAADMAPASAPRVVRYRPASEEPNFDFKASVQREIQAREEIEGRQLDPSEELGAGGDVWRDWVEGYRFPPQPVQPPLPKFTREPRLKPIGVPLEPSRKLPPDLIHFKIDKATPEYIALHDIEDPTHSFTFTPAIFEEAMAIKEMDVYEEDAGDDSSHHLVRVYVDFRKYDLTDTRLWKTPPPDVLMQYDDQGKITFPRSFTTTTGALVLDGKVILNTYIKYFWILVQQCTESAETKLELEQSFERLDTKRFAPKKLFKARAGGGPSEKLASDKFSKSVIYCLKTLSPTGGARINKRKYRTRKYRRRTRKYKIKKYRTRKYRTRKI
jgi:hypothetical protein